MLLRSHFHELTLARGQSWGILGYVQRYTVSKDEASLWAAYDMSMPLAVAVLAKESRNGFAGSSIGSSKSPSGFPWPHAQALSLGGEKHVLGQTSQGLAALGQDMLVRRYHGAVVVIMRELLSLVQSLEETHQAGRATNAIEILDEMF
ncbi:hypothetical protein G7Z17_g11849 [Cylindrodendrum hubeiense]|uniref:Uncharacterized protein n=1 Tax=Cylindrodendrum hubeiense TaxID=595255 RepID=A0A9P5H494_9HYPO|nr:hypothetical protein G7Z17_g11849 [Cylindrodendrum hubeiense]